MAGSPSRGVRRFLVSTTLAGFADDRRGAIAIPFAFMLTVMCLLMGAAVDLGMWMQARQNTLEAMDAAVLAGLHVYQTEAAAGNGNAATDAAAAAQISYNANVTKRAVVVSDTVGFQLINNNTEMQATGDAYFPTIFLKLAGIPKLPLLKVNGSENSISMASVGTNAGQSLEVAIMIDNTGSMCESAATAGTGNCASPSKMATVISAANTLVEQVIWSDQSQYTSRISLIPFSEAVNLGSASLANAARGTLKTTGGNGSTVTYTSNGRGGYTPTATAAANVGTTPGWVGLYDKTALDDYSNSVEAAFWASSVCVTERTGTHAYDDTSPSTAPVGPLYNEPVIQNFEWAWYYTSSVKMTGSPSGRSTSTLTSGPLTTSTYGSTTTSGNTDWCPISATVMPLTSDKTALHNAINAMTPNGGTAGHIGTAWAWYTLSPNFNNLWPATTSDAQPYSQLQVLNAKGQPVLRKIAILMTDGDYNYEYTNGVYDGYANASPTNDTSLNQAKKLCTNMKAAGIEVFTIGAMVSSSAQSFLQSCATDSSHYYNATSTVALTAAFASITQKLVQLHLTN